MIIFFIRAWPEIRKSEIPLSKFIPIFGDRNKLELPGLQPLQFWELLRENQQGDNENI